MQTSHSANDVSPREAIAGLNQTLEKSFDQNRALLSEMARFAQNESLRFVQLQLDHAHHAFAQLDDHRDWRTLIGAQQEWVRDLMQDYAAQSLRYAEIFRSLAGRVQEQARHVAQAAADDAEEGAARLRKVGEAVTQAAQRAAE